MAFPVIGTGNLNFPPNDASRIMLEETIGFCHANLSSTLNEIRFVVYQQDRALVNAFGQEMAKFTRGTSARPEAEDRVCIEVLQGDLCHEKTDAIVNIISKDLNMENAGALSNAVKKASGNGVQDELNLFQSRTQNPQESQPIKKFRFFSKFSVLATKRRRRNLRTQQSTRLNHLGQQEGRSAVMTKGGNLAARHIIHLIPDSANKQQLQQCVEKCLQLAESSGIQSISFPAIGTGAYGMSATDSASLIFQALDNFSANFNTIRKVRIVIFQAQMLQVFQQEQQRHLSLPNQGIARPRATVYSGLSIEVINGDLTQETNDAIINIISIDMDMNKAGELSKAILRVSGQQIQQELSQLGKQAAGTAVMTSGGNLQVPRVIHIIPGLFF